jgi:L-threonylcarbamoyladenylate synthase
MMPAVTLRLTVDPVDPDPGVIESAASVIRSGGLVAFPTETVYGLGCDATDPAAVERLFAAKGRPPDDPLIVHVTVERPLGEVYAAVRPLLKALAARFWPGPLTLVGPRADAIPAVVTAGLDTVAARAPAHPVAVRLIRAVGRPLAAPSANLFGHVSPTSAAHVLDDLAGRCDLVLDAGDTTLGIESTVVRVEEERAVVLRHGAVPAEDLGVPFVEAPTGGLGSPGGFVRHYAPTAEMRVVDIASELRLPHVGRGVYLGFHETEPELPEGWWFVPLGSRDSLDVVAARLYAVLRSVDQPGVDLILAELTLRRGLGRAIDDRLTRAASGRVLR